jgi:antitoxin PrlF
VEQKNGAVVRHTVGYHRYGGLEAAAALARLCRPLRRAASGLGGLPLPSVSPKAANWAHKATQSLRWPLLLAEGLEGCKEISYLARMITSKLTSKAQTTVPQAVRTALGLKVGDEIAYVIEQGRVVLTRRSGTPEGDDPFATFSEWESAQDAQAYAGF